MVAPLPLRGIADTPSAAASAGVPPPPSPGDPLTSGVVSGSLWRLGGHAAVVVASLAATPFVLRLLGAERYGVLVLIQAMIEYAAFATLGTAVGSTRFGRWDVMTAITSGSAVLRLLCVPVVLALGGGLVAAVAAGVLVTLGAAWPTPSCRGVGSRGSFGRRCALRSSRRCCASASVSPSPPQPPSP